MRKSREFWLSRNAVLIYLALFDLLAHLAADSRYGFFRDELAYVDDGKHLAWGYVDHPPLSPLVAAFAHTLFGDSLSGYRLFAALAVSCAVILTGLIARALGANRFAEAVAAAAAMISPVLLSGGVLFQAVPFDLLFWVLCLYVVIRLIKTGNPKLWLWIGVILGLGMMTKYTILFFIAGLGVGMLLTPYRRYWRSKWLWVGVCIAGVIFLPNLLWQIKHDWVSLDYTNSINERDARIGRTSGFLPEQFLVATNPLTIPIWLAGLYFYLISKRGASYRWLGWVYVTALVLFVLMHGRSYYLGPAYPMLLAGGAVQITEAAGQRGRLYVRPLLAGMLVVGAVMAFPMTLPIAPINSATWDMANEVNDGFREMIGWKELVATTADLYHRQPQDQRIVIWAGNYGEAGAIDLYGPAYGLPRAISPANTYYYWSQGHTDGDIYIVLGYPRGYLATLFGEVQFGANVTNRYGVENEETQDHPVIYICRKPKVPLSELWPEMQSFG
jgi:4-amino-4-deoxy-L-arabinose transferase-like glycosyltransferase